MWNVVPSDRWNWSDLREMISKVGVRNSLLIAPMPTASTSQILGNNECFEPYTSNIYSRRVLRSANLLLVKRSTVVLVTWIFASLFWFTWLVSFWQWRVCCSKQASSPWFDWDGYLVPCSEKQDCLWRWFCSKDLWDPRWSESNLQVCELSCQL